LLTVSDTLKVKSTANDVVANTWKIRYTATANKHNGVFLEVMTFTADISPNFLPICQSDTGNFTKR
jgi:hypothetical protein